MRPFSVIRTPLDQRGHHSHQIGLLPAMTVMGRLAVLLPLLLLAVSVRPITGGEIGEKQPPRIAALITPLLFWIACNSTPLTVAEAPPLTVTSTLPTPAASLTLAITERYIGEPWARLVATGVIVGSPPLVVQMTVTLLILAPAIVPLPLLTAHT